MCLMVNGCGGLTVQASELTERGSFMAGNARGFSLVIGGPFHTLLSRLRLVGEDRLPTVLAALVLAMIAWLPSALLSVADHLYSGSTVALSYFTDYTAYIRGLLAISVMVITERAAHLRLTPIVNQFTEAHLIDAGSEEQYRDELRRADERSSSSVAELTLLIFVVLVAVFGTRLDLELGGFEWDGHVVDGQAVYSWAGWWSHWVTKPLFQFLVLRWFWRFAVWGWLLFRVSRMRLRLVAYHPDRSGGLGFLSVYPMVFSGLIFALSSVLGAELVSEFHRGAMSLEFQRATMLGWVVFMLLVFVGPLAVFVSPLHRLREQSIFRMGRIASEHQAAFQQKWLASGATGADLLGSADVSSASDIAPVAAAPYTLRVLPVTVPMAINLAVAAGVPMLVVLATEMPLKEFMSYVLATIL